MLLTEIFYHTDEFCKQFEKDIQKILLPNRKRNRKGSLTLSEIMTINTYFHHSGYKNFKFYYCKYVRVHLKKAFPSLVSYNRFVELQQQTALPLALLAKLMGKGKCSGVSFMDSFCLKVCHIRRVYSHKTFRGLATKGKTSVGWFYGFKVHLVISHTGEIIDFHITPGNVADNNLNVVTKITKRLFGRLFADKGYISRLLFASLYSRGITLFTRLRKNMKQKVMHVYDKFLLQKRGVIESVNAILKEDLCIEHTRHRSPINFLGNIFSAIVAYAFRPKKPKIHLPQELLETFA